MSGNFASPHGDDVDGKTMFAGMDINYSIVPVRPRRRHVDQRPRPSKLPADGTGARRARGWNPPGLPERACWSGAKVRFKWARTRPTEWVLSLIQANGIQVVRHGGSLFGYKSDMVFLPDHGVGAVILTTRTRADT